MFSMKSLFSNIGGSDDNGPASNNPYKGVGKSISGFRSMFGKKPQQSGSMLNRGNMGNDLFSAGNSFKGNFNATPQTYGSSNGMPGGGMMDYFRQPNAMVSPAALDTPEPMFAQPSFINSMSGAMAKQPMQDSGQMFGGAMGAARPQMGSFFKKYF